MSIKNLHDILSRLGFAQVDDIPGWRQDYKWRHRSALDTSGFGSIWVKTGMLSVNGKRHGGYERVLTRWAPPSFVDTSLGNPFSVWEGAALEALLAEMPKHVSPETRWPPPDWR